MSSLSEDLRWTVQPRQLALYAAVAAWTAVLTLGLKQFQPEPALLDGFFIGAFWVFGVWQLVSLIVDRAEGQP